MKVCHLNGATGLGLSQLIFIQLWSYVSMELGLWVRYFNDETGLGVIPLIFM